MAKKDTGGISASDIAKVASANASISLDISGDVKQSMLDFISVTNRMVSGSKIGQYFADTETLAKRLATAVRACNDDLKHINEFKPSNAKEVVNTFNALKASANGADVSSFFDKVDGGFRGIMSTVEAAQVKVGKFVEGFSEADFSRMFGSYQNIKTWADTLGLGTKEVENLMSSLTQLSGTDVSALTKQLEEARSQVRSLNEELTSVKSGIGFRELEAELEEVQSALTNAESKIERIRDKAVYEFRQYLSANLIDPDQFDDELGFPKFEYYIDNIRDGTFSAREAITQFRTEYEHLFENADQNQGVFSTAQVEAFTAKLEEIFTRVQEIGAYIQNTTSNAPGLVANAVEKDLENINKEEQALRHVIDEGGQLGQVAQIVEGVAEASSDGTQSMGQMSEQTVKLVESLTSLGQAGEDSLAAISSIFRNISGIKDLSVNTEEFSKLKVALESLKDMTGLEKIGLLSNINLQGLSGLSVSKASMYNLATYLPIISRDTDIGKLQALSQINLSNFNKDNLSVSKATMDNLKSLIETISGKDVNVTGDGQTQKLTAEQETVERLNTSYKTHSEAVARAIDEEQKKAIVSSELTAKLQREKEAMDAVSGAADKGTASGQKYASVWDKMFLGKFTAEFAKVKAQFDSLQDKPAKLAQNMQMLEAAEKQMRDATTMEEKIAAYEQFLTVIDVVRTQIGAVNAEAKNSNVDFKNILNAVKQASAAMDGIGNSAFTNKLKEMHARIKGIADSSVIDRFKELQKAYVEMQSAFGTSGPNTEQDYTALANAHARWKTALSGLNQALTTNRAVSAAANVANKDNVRTAKEIASASKEAQGQVNELSNVFAGLKDKTKFDTSAFERMSALLAEVNNESNDATTRQNALQKLNVLLGESAEKLNELSAAEREQSKLNNELENAEKRRSSMLQQLDTMLQQATAAERKYALSQATPELKEKYKQLKETSAGIREMADQLRSGVQPTDEMGNRIRKLKNDLGECTTAFKTSGNVISRWASAGLQQLKSRLTYTLGLAAIFTKTTQEIKKMITTAVELDSAMNTLQIVTRGSNADMEAYAKNVSQMAKETAQSTKDLIDATTVYARLGYSMDESAMLSKYTAMLQGVGDIDASSAQNAMTAIIKAFGKNVDDVEDVMNKLVVVGNNFPISVSQLAEGMNNASSMLAVAGNSLEESIALLTAANTTVQNISKASTGLRTIAARIRKTTTGEDGDEIVEEAKYQEMVNALTKQHVSLVDQVTGQYRSTYDIMKDIAAVWDQMTSMEQAAVIEALAGTRQQNIFTSLVTQFQEAEGALERMNNAGGELQESYDIYLNSIAAHVKTLQAAFDELSRDVVDSDLAKFAVDTVTHIVELLDLLVEKFGVIGPILVGAIGLGLRSVISQIAELGEAAGGITSVKDAFAALQLYTESLKGTFTKMLATAGPLVVVIGSLAAALLLYKKLVLDTQVSTEELAKDFKDAKNEASKVEKQLEVNNKRLEELNRIRNSGEWTEELEAERAGLESQNKELADQLGLLQDIAEYKKESYISRTNRDLDFFFGTGRTTEKDTNTFLGSRKEKSDSGYGGILNAVDDYEEALDRLDELYKRRKNKDWSNQAEAQALESDIVAAQENVAQYAQALYDFKANLIEQRNILAEATDEQSLKHIGQINEALELIAKTTGQGGKSFDDFKTKLKSLSKDALKLLTNEAENAEKAQKDLTAWMKKSGYSAEELAEYFRQYALELKQSAESTKEAAQKSIGDIAGIKDEIQEATAAWERYQEAINGGDKDSLINNLQEAWQKAIEDINAGKTDSNVVHAAIDLFIPPEVQKQLGYNVDRMAEYLNDEMFKYLFEENENDTRSIAQKFFELARDTMSREDGVWVEGTEIKIRSMEDLARVLASTKTLAAGVFSALDAYGAGAANTIEDNNALIDSYYDFVSKLGNVKDAVKSLVTEIYQKGYDRIDAHSILGEFLNNGVIVGMDTDQLHTQIDEVYDTLDKASEAEATPTADLNIDGIISGYDKVVNILNNLDSYTVHPKAVLDISYADEPTVSESASKTSSSSRYQNVHAFGAAEGKRTQKNGGDTLVNELGPELISDSGRAFIANGGKPGFVRLSENAIVFTADETKDILHGKRNVNGKALAGGNVGRGSLIGRLLSGHIYPGRYQAMGTTRATSPVVSRSVESVKRCPRCGSNVPYSYSVCPYCRYDFNSGGFSTAGTRTVTTNNQTRQTSVVTQYTRTSGGGYTDANPGVTYTNYGGSPSDLYSQPTTWKCPRCGATNSVYSSVCSTCAYPGADKRVHFEKGEDQHFGNGKNGGLAGSGGGNNVGGADYASSSDPQKVDWIAVKINRLERSIADLEKIATSGFKTLDKRLDAAKSQIKDITSEISVMESAYNRYLAEADKVDLSADIKQKIKQGAIDIASYDDETRKQIDEYTEWYEKAIDAKSAIEGLHQDIAQLYVDAFENVQKDYENQLAEIEHRANMTQKNLEMAQKRGYLDSATFYEQLAQTQSESINKLKVELDQLNAKMKEAMDSKEIDEGSEAYYQMKQAINEVKEAIADANIQLLEYQRTIRSLNWSYFDYAQERFSQLTEEANFFVQLMSNDELFGENGKFNQLGAATAGMHAVDYDVYMAQADEYAKEIQKIQRELEQDPYDQELISRRETLLGLQRQSILSAEAEKDAVKSLVQEGFNKELEALKKLIDAYNDSIDSAKSLYDYQKKVTEKTADIATIQKQLSAYTNDTSEETRAKVQKLQSDLKNAQTDLRETEWEQNIADQKKLLDDLYKEYEDYLNSRLDNVDQLMQDIIAGSNENMDSIRTTLVDEGDKVGYTMTDQMQQVLQGDLDYYNKMFSGITSVHVVLTNIYDMVAAMARASGAVKAYATGGLVDYTGLAAVHGTKGRPELMLNASDTENFLEAARMMRDLYGAPSLSALPNMGGNAGGMTIGQLQVNIPIDRVQDYNDMISQMRDDPKFEKLISAMTLDRAVGKSSFGKNKIIFS